LKLGGTIKTYPISSIIDKSISQIPPRWAQESLQNGRKVKEIKKVINYNDPIVLFVSILFIYLYLFLFLFLFFFLFVFNL